MNKLDLINYIFETEIFLKWHWFWYHFNYYKCSLEHPFVESLLDALLNIDKKIEGYSIITINRIASISGKERYVPHYEQLLQICAEVYVINQAVKYFNEEKYNFQFEPTCGASKKNPEIVIIADTYKFGIEVKQPSLIEHIKNRGKKPIQVSTRIDGVVDTYKEMLGEGAVVLPRDNPVKDFLISSNEKFKKFKETENFYSILFIVWDDFIYEPISALIGEPSGLFMDGSFAKDKEGKRLIFNYVDAVFIDRQLSQFLNATRDTPLLYNKRHAMEYGQKGEFPYKFMIKNPNGSELPKEIEDCFQVQAYTDGLGAEYLPSDIIMWI